MLPTLSLWDFDIFSSKLAAAVYSDSCCAVYKYKKSNEVLITVAEGHFCCEMICLSLICCTCMKNNSSKYLIMSIFLQSGGLASPSQTGGGGVGVVGSVDGGRDETLMTSSLVVTSPPRHTLRHRPPGTLPTHEDSADDLDNLDDVSHTHSGIEFINIVLCFYPPVNCTVSPLFETTIFYPRLLCFIFVYI